MNIDKLIAQENRRFLNDPKAVADAEHEGEMYRLRMEAEGILPPLGEPCRVCGDPRHETVRPS